MSQALMSSVPVIRGAAHGPTASDRVLAFVAAAAASVTRAWQLRQDRLALDELDARGLADLGIGRGQIEGAIRFGRIGIDGRPERPVADRAAAMPLSWTEWR